MLLESNNVKNIYKALEEAQKDEAVQIKIIELAGDENFALYAAEIEGYKRVGAHYHTKGMEIYQVIQGKGEIYLGTPQNQDQVEWGSPIEVKGGDCFTVKENQAHQLVNTTSESLIITFVCPYSHLSSDRILVEGVKE